MSTQYTSNDVLNAVAAACKVLGERKEEINRLNVFPVPDGDTGTNMSLTIESVVTNVARLPIGASGADIEALARAVRERVLEAFGVTLVPEPVTVGIAW